MQRWDDGKRIRVALNDIRHTYAQTVHTSQGSTYDIAVLDMQDLRSSGMADPLTPTPAVLHRGHPAAHGPGPAVAGTGGLHLMHQPCPDRMEEALRANLAWAEAYPVEVFPPVDLDAARARLGDDGLFSRLHAEWARHILKGVAAEARRGLC